MFENPALYPESLPQKKEITKEKIIESDSTVVERLPHAQVALVLGAELKKTARGVELGIESKMRALGAAHLLNQGTVDHVLLAGGITKEFPDVVISSVMKEYLVRHGVSEEKILIEDQSKNTTENIENALDILEAHKIATAILETSQYHLARAKQLYAHILEKKGLHIKTAYVDAEELLDKRSSHYKSLTEHYAAPTSLTKAPIDALYKGGREFLRRILIAIDRDDKLATFFARKLR